MTAIKNIDVKTLKEWIGDGKVLLLDVREAVENKSCAINGSVNIPLSNLSLANSKIEDSGQKKIVIHCKSGKRSMMACEKLRSEGYDGRLFNLQGGIDGWVQAGYKIKKQKNIMSLERQVHLVISIMILTGLAAHHLTFNELYLLLPLVAGVGLLNSAITGWCGMAKLIAKMPWNK